MWSRRFPSLWASATLLLTLAIALPLESAKGGIPVDHDLVNIPVERLIENLEALTRIDPKNVQVRFNLARAHAMAYALRTDTVRVRKNKEKESNLFGSKQNSQSTVTPTDDKDKLKAANEHLAKAIEQYEEVLRLAPDNLVAALGYSWCVEQSGQKRKAVEEYRKPIQAAWMKEKDLKYADIFGWHSITAEAAGYLIPLLDKDKDKSEIKMLQERIKRFGTVRRPISPIVIPLHDGLTASDLEDHSANVSFDADGTGQQKRWTWITNDAGWLVNDPHHTGKVTSALQLFGNVTFWMFWENGYNALAALDDDRDGMLAAKELQGLAIWQDLNRNGISERGEVKRLAEWGLVAISCGYVTDMKHPDRIAYSPRGVFFRDGSNRPTYDIILHPAIATVD